jgi:hypothetical protein
VSKRQDRAIKRRALRAMPNMENDPIARGVGMIVVSFTQPIQVDAPCHYCGNLATTRDHIVPKGKRGTDAWWNLVPACEPCNRRKSDADTWCRCAFCARAVFLFELGHMRPERSPRQAYMEPKPPRARKKSRRAKRPQGPPEKGYLDMMKVQAPPIPDQPDT